MKLQSMRFKASFCVLVTLTCQHYFQILESFLFLPLWLISRSESSEAKGLAHVISNFKWPLLRPYLGMVLHPNQSHTTHTTLSVAMQIPHCFPEGTLSFIQTYCGIAKIQINKNTFGGCTVPSGLCLLVYVDDPPPVILYEILSLL